MNAETANSNPVPVCPHCGKPLRREQAGAMPGGKLRGQFAYEAYETGLSWASVARQLGYTGKSSQGTARQLAWDWAVVHKRPFPPPRAAKIT